MTLLKENKLAAASVVAVIAGLIAFYTAFWGTSPETEVTAPAVQAPAAAAAPAGAIAGPVAPEASGAPQAPAAPAETTVVPVAPTDEPAVSH